MGTAYLKCGECGRVYVARDNYNFQKKKYECPECGSDKYTLDHWIMS